MCNGPQQQVPGYHNSLQAPTQTYGNGIQGPRPWTSVPFMQTYGGQTAPWADLSTQTLAAWNGTQNGAGRFNGNNAARYGFAGPWQQQPDTRQAGGGLMPQGPGGGGMSQAGGTGGYNMRGDAPMSGIGGSATPGVSGQGFNPMSAVDMNGNPQGAGQYGNRPGAGGAPQPPTNRGTTGGPDPMAGFQSLLQQDPRAASEALNFNPGWFQKNQGALAGMVPGGDLGAWRNQTQPGASNVGAISDEQRALIRSKMGW